MTSMPSAALVPKRPGRELELAFGSTLRACRRCGGSRSGSRGRVKGSIRGRLQAQLTGPFFSLLLCCLQWLLADWPGKTLVSIDYRWTSPCTESMFGHKTVIGRILVMPASASWRQRLGLVSLQGATESLIFSLLCREKRRELGAGFQTARRRPKGAWLDCQQNSHSARSPCDVLCAMAPLPGSPSLACSPLGNAFAASRRVRCCFVWGSSCSVPSVPTLPKRDIHVPWLGHSPSGD